MSDLASLTSLVTARAIEVSKLVAEQSLKQLSFHESSLSGFEGEDINLRRARYELSNAAKDLARLAQGPEDHILELAWSTADTSNLAVLLRFDIAQSVPLGTGIPATDLAKAVGLPECILSRIVRYAIGNGIFCEPTPGTFSHNASSALLARNEHIRNIAVTSTRELSSILLRLGDALKQQLENGTEGAPQAAFNLAYSGYPSIFEFLAKNPDSAQRYHKYMVGRANTSRWKIDHMLNAYDWNAVGSMTIIDVGGSMGHTTFALAPACPDATFIVQDVDPVALDQGRQMLGGQYSALSPRISFQLHDIFQTQPTVADIYLFRHVFHDWSDADTVRILQSLAPTLKKGARVLVSEGIVPEPPAAAANTLDQKQILVEDMFMLAVHSGCERTVADFVRLFSQADERFKFLGQRGGKDGAFQSLLEFEFQG